TCPIFEKGVPMARSRTTRSRPTASPQYIAKPLCKNLPRTLPQLPAHVMSDVLRARAIIQSSSKWANGTLLHYCFFTGNSHYAVPKKQADAIRGAFAKWKAVGIGLDFKEVAHLSEAEVRIGYSTADGESASAVGKEILSVPLSQP